MIKPQFPQNEEQRLEAVFNANILDTLPEKEFDDLTFIASSICNTPISLITILDKERQWFKSKIGIDVDHTERQYAFCAHAILNPNEMLEVSDSREDERFIDNPLVTDEPHVIFYAGVPLVDKSGLPYGTICVIDQKPRNLTDDQKKALKALASLVMNQIELRSNRKHLQEINSQLESYAYTVAHDLKSPLSGIIALVDLINHETAIKEHKEIQEYLSLISDASKHLANMISHMLESARVKLLDSKKEHVDVHSLVENIIQLLFPAHNIKINFVNHLPEIYTIKIKLLQIFQNLLSNAIKYNHQQEGLIEIGCTESSTHYTFFVKDNGPGISDDLQKIIFNLFEIGNHQSKIDNSTGIGLSSIKKIITEMGGTIWLESKANQGACFYFTWRK